MFSFVSRCWQRGLLNEEKIAVPNRLEQLEHLAGFCLLLMLGPDVGPESETW